MELFVYGTLVNPALVRSLTGKTVSAKPARLTGFRRFQNPGSYPYILPSPDDCVEGVILCSLDAADLEKLDRYEAEGDLYFRTEIEVQTDCGPRRCETYVGNPSAVDRLEVS